MSNSTQNITAEIEEVVPKTLEDFYLLGWNKGMKAYLDNEKLEPDLSDLVNNAQRQAYVKGFTTVLRQLTTSVMNTVTELEVVWHYDEENNQSEEEEK
ncbi:hypothetical protein MTBPR1_200022 [Candidatus Terasakiella magnetica]|uniref:Uncharacterized protein n=1 Tax=Candidatus Terasakiella magnetica TaxID=1867952 RepID=A0A1C3RH69_9PROT|nr:hypothetical protein [Candidatus Terasakiella magnetica]SCA56542.1 hypothetical protein MTBPR1_200022 [Candidatus Terasakiella magnetica]